MITYSDILKIKITQCEMMQIKIAISPWDTISKSAYRSDEERINTFDYDWFDGVVGQFAYHKYQFGLNASERFFTSMWHQRKRNGADGGHDVDCLNVDVKTTARRCKSASLLNFKIGVSDGAYHANWIYVLCIIDYSEDRKSAMAHLIGYCTTHNLPEQKTTEGKFRNCYCVEAKQLTRLMPTRWSYFDEVTP